MWILFNEILGKLIYVSLVRNILMVNHLPVSEHTYIPKKKRIQNSNNLRAFKNASRILIVMFLGNRPLNTNESFYATFIPSLHNMQYTSKYGVRLT
jgi:hypothetical protein